MTQRSLNTFPHRQVWIHHSLWLFNSYIPVQKCLFKPILKPLKFKAGLNEILPDGLYMMIIRCPYK